MTHQNNEFEKWYKEKHFGYDLYPKYYQFRKEVKEAFEAGWQAATQHSEREIAELKAHINVLREALEFYAKRNHIQHLALPVTAEKALASTPAQSLQAHDDEVIERCAKHLYDEGYFQASNKIRVLKGTS